MPSRADKERILKRNIEINAARAIKQWEQQHRTKCPIEKKREFRRLFQDVAKKYNDKQLAEIWNN